LHQDEAEKGEEGRGRERGPGRGRERERERERKGGGNKHRASNQRDPPATSRCGEAVRIVAMQSRPAFPLNNAAWFSYLRLRSQAGAGTKKRMNAALLLVNKSNTLIKYCIRG
jgi:hypothetical protein